MIWFFLTSALGWLASLLFSIEALLPYLLRRSRLSSWLGTAHSKASYLQRLRTHFWFGYLLLPLAFAHAWIPMQGGSARGANAAGLWIATLTLILLFYQTVLGFALKNPASSNRTRLRRLHFYTMAAIGLTLFAHIVLNS